MNPDCRGSTPGPLGCVMTQHFSIAATNDAGSREMTGMARGMKRREFTLPRSPRMVWISVAIAACNTSGSSTTCLRIEDASASYAANANFLGRFSNALTQFLGLSKTPARLWSLVRCDRS